MSNMNYEGILSVKENGSVPLDIHFPSCHRIRGDIFDQAFPHRFERHDDLLCLHHVLYHAFFVSPGDC
jgi:hypothetical protein